MNEIQQNEKKAKLKIPKDLVALNKLFESNGFVLYIVGGYIRDYFLKIPTTDIDICSSAKPEDLERMLKGTNFVFTLINKRLGTYKISTKNKSCSFEYTTFRKERYDQGHCPSYVEFVGTVEEDAERRDFTVDCIYYNLQTKEFFDPYDGITDCNRRRLRTIHDQVFNVDGLRILRMLRIAYTKNLQIDRTTYSKALNKMHLLDEISHERIARELRAMFVFQQSGYKFKKVRFSEEDLVRILAILPISKNIFPEISKEADFDILFSLFEFPEGIGDLAKYDLIIALVYLFVINVEKTNQVEVSGEFYMDLLGSKGLMLPHSVALKYRVIVDGLVTLNKMYEKSLFINYIQLYFPFLEEIEMARRALMRGDNDENLQRIISTNKLMLANNIPRNIVEINVTVQDILTKWPNLPKNQISVFLEGALLIATTSRINEKDFLLKELEKLYEIILKDENKNDK